MTLIPHEFNFHGVYLSPLLVAAFFGTLAACCVAYVLDRYRLSRFFLSSALVFIALCALFTCVIGAFVIPS